MVWIAHELTQHTRRFLVRGTLDAIINQDPGHEARSAARVLLAHCSGEPISPDQERIRIDIFLRDNLPDCTFSEAGTWTARPCIILEKETQNPVASSARRRWAFSRATRMGSAGPVVGPIGTKRTSLTPMKRSASRR